jgi:hypothetical protein
MQADLFGDDIPEYKPPHPSLEKVSSEALSSDGVTTYFVNLGTGECTCNRGDPWRRVKGEIEPNFWCSHKIKTLAAYIESLDEKTSTRNELQIIYNKRVSERYILWEALSAFHKELRRGDYDAAMYWSLSVANHRGLSGVVRYMLSIVFEETRDLVLYEHLLNVSELGRNVTFLQVCVAVKLFCASPKKWELPGRLNIFITEMQGYRALAKKYTYNVAKPKDIIPASEIPALKDALEKGFYSGDKGLVQYGMKGLYKSCPESNRTTFVNELYTLLKGIRDTKTKFSVDPDYTEKLFKLVYRKRVTFGDLGYHELNALCDALTGESYPNGANTTKALKRRAILALKRSYAPPLGELRRIPLYALDNHNYQGKHLMSKWGAVELLPKAEQKNLDFRWCGAYMGLAWRYLAYSQKQTCEVPWGTVNWKPAWLWPHLNMMWY